MHGGGPLTRWNVTDPEVERYAAEHSTAESPALARLAAETQQTMEIPGMMVGALEGRFLEMVVHMTGARRVLEIGTFTGYSALSMAAALPAEGQLITCEVNPDAAAIARRHFDDSPFGDRIDLRLGPALETVAGLDGQFDMVFIDADKTNYANYYEATLPLLSERGVMLVDNVLWSGRVLDPDDTTDDTRAIVEFNDQLRNDARVVCVMVPIRDGVSVIRRR